MNKPLAEHIDHWRRAHPEIGSLRVAVADLNAMARAKRLAVPALEKVWQEGIRMPLSVSNLDIWGADIEDSPLVFESGDADGVVLPTGRLPLPMPWLSRPAALIHGWFFTETPQGDLVPFAGDGRQALARVLERYAARGWRPVIGSEMEFHLLEKGAEPPEPAVSPATGRPFRSSEILSLRELDAVDPFLSSLYDTLEAMDVPAGAAIVESGIGQFELDISHQGDALKAADDIWAFRLAAKGEAARQGMMATFMAKPWPDLPGNGMHLHVSVLDEDGRNIFDDGTPGGSAYLKAAVAGLLEALPDLALVFFPHRNSWRRMEAGSHAPTRASWGYENRTAAIRIPGGPTKARRLEFRVAGGDANPWLTLAAVLGAMLAGIDRSSTPPEPVTGNAYADQSAPLLPQDWQGAIERFASSPRVAEIFAPELIDGFTRTKVQERARFMRLIAQEGEKAADVLEFSTYPHRL